MIRVLMASASTHRGLGITAGLDAGLARELAARCEGLGYHSLWSNDEGVLPLHRHKPVRIAAEVDRLGLDPARLWLGIGSGALPRQVDPLRRAVAELRALLPEATRIMLAAMRPCLCRLGGAIADGVLLNWMLPNQAARAREWVREGAAQSGRPAPVIASYVRVAVGPGAAQRLRAEEGFYRTINEGHRKHFAAMNVPVGAVGIAASQRSEVAQAFAAYHAALDLPIARVLADADATSLRTVTDAAAPF
jgi:alkanesulfonate monooxygenase SsuD/methylene tetrahydromethanopterin reductase-like flavin-dependent oxidoreductase (luciferase family)